MLKTTPARTKKVIEILMDWYQKKTEIFTNAELPEALIPEGITIGSYDHIMFLTQSVSIDYMRSAQQLWDAARTTWKDETTRWVFYPKEIAKRNLEDLIDAMSKHKLSKKHTKDPTTWRKVALSFNNLFDGDPRNLFQKFNYDALQIFNSMRSQYGKDFPYLAGSTGTSKILSLWIRMLHDFAKVEFRNLNEVPIPVDIHTARATITTGCLAGEFSGTFGELADKTKKAWIEACEGTGFYPLQLDEPLWNLSRYGCSNYKNGSTCPVRHQCRLRNYCVTENASSKIFLQQNNTTTIVTEYPEQQ
ncbi:hypothetical protein [Candidatus Nitrosotenuis cloacae]|uniref:hypothetical protein n=1 Tax=Candidatus Nitrosotenuis cloacae TaxID=1603555 RepID=UPI00227F74C2|nr:hypothetical protein [Candidatus Nitrosotenuis cloacae]